jgi:hypothetical protein
MSATFETFGRGAAVAACDAHGIANIVNIRGNRLCNRSRNLLKGAANLSNGNQS